MCGEIYVEDEHQDHKSASNTTIFGKNAYNLIRLGDLKVRCGAKDFISGAKRKIERRDAESS